MEGNAPPSGTGPGPHGDVLHAATRHGARDGEETTSMAEHGRGAGGRHAAPGEARAAAGATATVGAPTDAAPQPAALAGRRRRPDGAVHQRGPRESRARDAGASASRGPARTPDARRRSR